MLQQLTTQPTAGMPILNCHMAVYVGRMLDSSNLKQILVEPEILLTAGRSTNYILMLSS